MGKNKDRYGKLELEEGGHSSGRKKSGFKRKLEIFGLPSQKKNGEFKVKRPTLDDLTPPPERKVSARVKKSAKTAVSGKRRNPEKPNLPVYKKRKVRKRHKRIVRRKQAERRVEQARRRVESARSTVMWSVLLIIGVIVLLYQVGEANRELVIEIGLALLFVFLGIRGGYRRWWH